MKVSLDRHCAAESASASRSALGCFVLNENGIAYVSEGGAPVNPGGPDQWAKDPAGLESMVLDAAAECPTQAIFVNDGEAADQAEGETA